MSFPWTSFSEVQLQTLMFGNTLRASTLSQINKNTQQAVLTPEFFAPVEYENGDTIPLPTSPVDGYEYARVELIYVWEWYSNDADDPGRGGFLSGTNHHYRVPGLYATVDSEGLVHIKVWRLKPNGPYVTEPDGSNALLKIRVLVIGIRGLANSGVSTPTDGSPSDSGDTSVDNDGTSTGINTQSGTSYTLQESDNGGVIRFTSSSAVAVTVPASTDVNFPVGATINLRQVGTGTVTISGDTGVTVNAASFSMVQNSNRVLVKVDTDEWDLSS